MPPDPSNHPNAEVDEEAVVDGNADADQSADIGDDSGDFLDEALARAERLTGDPLQQVLLVAGACAEAVGRGTSTPRWRRRIGGKLREAAAIHPPRLPVDPESLADLLSVIVEGAARAPGEAEGPRRGSEALRHYRTYLELLFDVAE